VSRGKYRRLTRRLVGIRRAFHRHGLEALLPRHGQHGHILPVVLWDVPTTRSPIGAHLYRRVMVRFTPEPSNAIHSRPSSSLLLGSSPLQRITYPTPSPSAKIIPVRLMNANYRQFIRCHWTTHGRSGLACGAVLHSGKFAAGRKACDGLHVQEIGMLSLPLRMNSAWLSLHSWNHAC
jgi:hypothetical protein